MEWDGMLCRRQEERERKQDVLVIGGIGKRVTGVEDAQVVSELNVALLEVERHGRLLG